MATESPIRILESDESKQWRNAVDPTMFSSHFSSAAANHEGFTKVLMESGVFGEQTRAGPSRSGSAPPTVEGSIAAFRTFADQKNPALTNSRSEFFDCESEEQMRTDPAYIAYYYANVNLNPRLPPPLISRENRDLVRLIRGVGTKKKPVTEGFLVTHREEPEEGISLQQPVGDQKHMAGPSLAGHDRSKIDLMEGGLFQASEPASTPDVGGEKDHVTDTISTTNQISEKLGLSSGFTDMHYLNSHASVSRSSFPSVSSCPRIDEAEENVSTQSNIDSDSSSEKSRIKSLSISGDFLIGDNQKRLDSLYLHEHSRLPDHPLQSSAYHATVLQSNLFPQGTYASHYGIEKLVNAHPKVPVMQPFMHGPHGPGLVPPVYATTAAYMNAANLQYPSLPQPGFPIPQVGLGGYSASSGLHPPHFGGYLQNNVYPMQTDAYPTMGYFKPPMEALPSETSPYTNQLMYLRRHYAQHQMMLRHTSGPLQGQFFHPGFQEVQRVAVQHNLTSGRDTDAGSSTGYKEAVYPAIGNLSMSPPTTANHIGVSYFGYPPPIGVPHFPAHPSIPASPISGMNHTGLVIDLTASQHSPKDPSAFSGWKEQRGSESSDECKRNYFVELLKSSRNLELSDISGQIADLSTDQHGSRFIQQKLEHCSAGEKESVFQEVLPHASKLMTDVFGNYVIQKFFEYGTLQHRRLLGDKLAGQMLALSLQMYGCRVIQKALEVIELDHKVKLVQELNGHVMRCVHDQNGNHVIQKCIESVPAENIGFIISSFANQVESLSSHPYGCRVIQRVLEHCSDEQISQGIIDEILESSCTLALDPYGNYVTQHVLETGKPQERSKIIQKLTGKFVQMSQHKFASNVVEKCLKYGDASERDLIIEEFIAESDNNDALLVMMKDQFANYVVQKILDIGSAKQKDALLNCIKSHLAVLKRFTYAKQIVARYELLTEGSPQEQK